MFSQRQRAVVWAAVAIGSIWALATAGYLIFANARMTAAKVKAYVESVALDKLSAAARAKALRELAEKMNALSMEERQQLRLERTAEKWFTTMTEAEKATFIEATLPTGFKQMITAFEQQPEDKRRRMIDGALKRLREARPPAGNGDGGAGGNNQRAPISPELEAKVRSIGLQTFFSQSSAQTKAELAPLLEEMQQAMQSGKFQRR